MLARGKPTLNCPDEWGKIYKVSNKALDYNLQINPYSRITNKYISVHYDRRSFEFEDLTGSSPPFSRSLSQEHHYEDILGQSALLSITDFKFKLTDGNLGQELISLA